MKRKQVYLPEVQIKQVEDAGDRQGICFSEMLRRIIAEYFERKGKCK
jgi:hypothetical protein